MTDTLDFFTPIARATDPQTSQDAAAKTEPRRGTQASQLLALYRAYGHKGLTDAEAETYSLIKGAWKRCSDLRNAGLIRPNGEVRDGQRVCVPA